MDPVVHSLKCWPQYFNAILSRIKRDELRKDDRAFCTGDVLLLFEWDPLTLRYTGRSRVGKILWCFRGGPVPKGYVFLCMRWS